MLARAPASLVSAQHSQKCIVFSLKARAQTWQYHTEENALRTTLEVSTLLYNPLGPKASSVDLAALSGRKQPWRQL
jgi:hypothetical protein